MHWSIRTENEAGAGEGGVEGLILRMERELRKGGPPIQGFRFLTDGLQMLDITREIENELLSSPAGSDLYVGFQTAAKLEGERERYAQLRGAGVSVVAFGTGTPAPDAQAAVDRWIELPRDVRAFENQWFLVSSRPTPIAFAGWEVSEELFGEGGLRAPGKRFRGFISDDQRVVQAMIAHLNHRSAGGAGQRIPVLRAAEELPQKVTRVLALTDRDPGPDLAEACDAAAMLASELGAELVLYDLSAASYLVSPYPTELSERENAHRLEKKQLRRFGRDFLADQLDVLEQRGVRGAAILPTAPGFAHLADWVERESVELIVVPGYYERPALIDRLKGYSVSALGELTKVPVLIHEGGNAAHFATTPGA